MTVESLRVAKDKTLARFNIRTTDQDAEQVKNKILEAFGPSLARVEMTVGEAKPIAGGPPRAAGSAKTGDPLTTRFAGGREYPPELQHHGFQQHPGSRPGRDGRVRQGSGSSRASPTPRPGSRSQPAKISREAEAAPAAATNLVLRTDLEPDIAQTQLAKLKESLASNRDLLFERITNFGGTVAAETRTLALIATVASWVIIIVYLWWRFHSFTYGLAAVLAVVHDVLITLGAIAVSYWVARIPVISQLLMIDQFKIDLPIVAAFLTLIGFSVNDTIVIFDRIREIKGKTPHLTNKMVNDAINQTLSRTILTSLTAWLVVVILYILGGEGLHGFAFALVVGFLSGTYSTVYIATPILIDWVGTKTEPVTKAGEKEKAVDREVNEKCGARLGSGLFSLRNTPDLCFAERACLASGSLNPPVMSLAAGSVLAFGASSLAVRALEGGKDHPLRSHFPKTSSMSSSTSHHAHRTVFPLRHSTSGRALA